MSTKNTQNLINYLNDKDKEIKVQFNKVYNAFFSKPSTMYEVEKSTNVRRENICRYVNTLRKSNQIFLIQKRKCSITSYPRVSEYTTNPDLLIEIHDDQLKLF